MASLSTLESDCIKKLAKLFHEGKDFWTEDAGLEVIGLTEGNRGPVLSLLASMGIISEVGHVSESPFCHFRITPKVIVVERELREQEEQAEKGIDQVNAFKDAIRQYRFVAYGIIAFAVLVGLVSLAANTLTLIEKIEARIAK